jgi:hypothetical protein
LVQWAGGEEIENWNSGATVVRRVGRRDGPDSPTKGAFQVPGLMGGAAVVRNRRSGEWGKNYRLSDAPNENETRVIHLFEDA